MRVKLKDDGEPRHPGVKEERTRKDKDGDEPKYSVIAITGFA
jgi:hypothetical protein